MPSKNDLKNYLSFTEKIAVNVGSILLKKRPKAKIIKYKDRLDIATSVDIYSEKYVIEKVLDNFPKHTIFSEEKGEINEGSDYKWIVDPLDGTKEYVRDIPLWNFSITLEYKNEPVISAVYRPFEKSLYSAAKEMGSFLNGVKIRVSKTLSLENSFVYCYLPSYNGQKEKYQEAFDDLAKIGKRAYRLRSLANGNTALCWLAHGGMDAYINLSNPPKWHDIAPGLLIANEAGAYVCDRNGNTFDRNNFKGIVVTGNKTISLEIVKLIS